MALSASLSLAWGALGVAILVSLRKVRPLSEVLAEEPDAPETGPGPEHGPPPSLSVVVTARDEAAWIEATVRGILAQRYAALQLVVVDDRSTDGTPGILRRLAGAAGPGGGRLDVLRIEALPEGWLGKCHACHRGAQRAAGEWILFMDGDVELLDPRLLERVVRLAARRGLDHVALVPDSRPMSPAQAGLMSLFAQMYLTATLAFEMDRDRPRGGGGIGAFNLVRREAYERVGGHALLRFDLADDFKLGRLLKESGARQRFYDALGLVRCPWHQGALRVIRGLEKNFFAGLDYSVSELLAFTAAALGLAFGPLLLGLLAAAWSPLLVQAALVLAIAARQAPSLGVRPPVLVTLIPFSLMLLLAAAWNSALRILWRGGVIWRGTFYPLDALRRGLVPRGEGRRAVRGEALPPP